MRKDDLGSETFFPLEVPLFGGLRSRKRAEDNSTGYNARKMDWHQPQRFPCEMLAEIVRTLGWIATGGILGGPANVGRYAILL